MPDLMSKAELLLSLSHLLSDSHKFVEEAQDDILNNAVNLLSRYKRYIKPGSIELVVDTAYYDVPDDFMNFHSSSWGQKEKADHKPWESQYPGTLPLVNALPAARLLQFNPAPSYKLLQTLGHHYQYNYCALHHIDEDGTLTTVSPFDRDLLLLAGMAEAMKTMAARGVMQTVAAKHSISGVAKNGTPSALYEKFLKAFKEAALC